MSNPIKNLESGFGYEIYPRTFNDTDANGVGDIKGIIEKLPYLSFLGINKIWICPIFVSPGVDCGYDVEDYFNIGNDFGTIEDLEELIAKARQYNIGILLDLVPNHCSNKHTLFQKALSGLNSEERDMFIFRDPKEDGTPPNNWLSHFGGPAWTVGRASGQYYLHLFYSEQPDFNWRNPKVHEYFENVLRFWLELGLAGFRIDVTQGLYKEDGLTDANIIDPNLSDDASVDAKFKNLDPSNYYCLPETPKVFEQWKKIASEYGAILIGEMATSTEERLMPYFSNDGMDSVTYLESCWSSWEPKRIIKYFKEGEEKFRNRITWMMSNHDNKRAVTRYGGGALGLKRALATTSFSSLVSGIPFLYQGEELGLEDTPVEYENLRDPVGINFPDNPENGRDPCRTNMPWDSNRKWQGFSDSEKPWLTSPDRALNNCVDVQLADENSPLYSYKNAVALRSTIYSQIIENNYDFEYFGSETLYGYLAGPFLVALNADSIDVKHDIEGKWVKCYCSDLSLDTTQINIGNVTFTSEATTVFKKR